MVSLLMPFHPLIARSRSSILPVASFTLWIPRLPSSSLAFPCPTTTNHHCCRYHHHLPPHTSTNAAATTSILFPFPPLPLPSALPCPFASSWCPSCLLSLLFFLFLPFLPFLCHPPTDLNARAFVCTGISLMTEYFVLEYS